MPIRSSRKLAAAVILGLAAMLASIALVGVAYIEHTRAQTDRFDSQKQRLDAQQAEIAAQSALLAAQHFALHLICIAIRNENGLITKTLKRSQRNLPRLTYFQQHPAELVSQQAEITRELAVFRPRTCK